MDKKLNAVMQHNKEAEQNVLGFSLTSASAVSKVCEILKVDDFYFEQNRVVFSVILELFNENTPIDIVTVSNRLEQYDKLYLVGGIQYLSSLILGVPTTGNAEYYAKEIKDKANIRNLCTNADDAVEWLDSKYIINIGEITNSIVVIGDNKTESVTKCKKGE